MSIFDKSLTASRSLPRKGADGHSALVSQPKKLLPSGECETHFVNRVKARVERASDAIDPMRQINLKFPVPSTRQIFMCDVQSGQCRWIVDEFEDQKICCGLPVVDRLAREGRREKTHCQAHLEISRGNG